MDLVLFDDMTPTLPCWKQTLKDCVHSAINDDHIDVVISPDLDGVLSYFFLVEYLKKINVTSCIIGQYNSEELVKFTDNPNFKNALYLDLDVRFAKHVIGQHFIGDVEVPKVTYFNPNIFFGIKQYTNKYCFGTCHLLLWALFKPEEFPILCPSDCNVNPAISLVVHADSMYSNCRIYHRNAMNWSRKLFGDIDNSPYILKQLLDRSYFNNCLLNHKNMISLIKGCLNSKEKSQDNVTWSAFSGYQTCENYKIFDLYKRCSIIFKKDNDEKMKVAPKTFWKGEIRYVQRHVVDDIGAFVSNNVQSHAIVNTRTISTTFGSPPF